LITSKQRFIKKKD